MDGGGAGRPLRHLSVDSGDWGRRGCGGEGLGCGDRYAQAVQSIGVEIAALSKSVMNETDSGGD